MVLVTGPTGSGKTTTLYARARRDQDRSKTRSSPSKTRSSTSCSGITQIPINEKKGLTFARGLRSILRHDPDKIMVGEIRDPETAQIAIQSALTGHLVFTTVHANNVFDVLGRFLNMGVEPYQFISALNCVLAQRLVRKICEPCKQPVTLDRELLMRIGDRPGAWPSRHTFYEGAGCIECSGTGFKGRMAICELLDLTDHIREIILDKRPISEVKRAAKEQGMRLLRESAVERVMLGLDDAPRNQQGDLRRMSLRRLFQQPPPDVAVDMAPAHVAAARRSAWRHGHRRRPRVEPLPAGAVAPRSPRQHPRRTARGRGDHPGARPLRWAAEPRVAGRARHGCARRIVQSRRCRRVAADLRSLSAGRSRRLRRSRSSRRW